MDVGISKTTWERTIVNMLKNIQEVISILSEEEFQETYGNFKKETDGHSITKYYPIFEKKYVLLGIRKKKDGLIPRKVYKSH